MVVGTGASVVFWADLVSDFWTYLPECVRDGASAGAAEAMEKQKVKSRWSMEPDPQALFHEVFAEPSADDSDACQRPQQSVQGVRIQGSS